MLTAGLPSSRSQVDIVTLIVSIQQVHMKRALFSDFASSSNYFENTL